MVSVGSGEYKYFLIPPMSDASFLSSKRVDAGVAQLVEHFLAKEDVARSSRVTRSKYRLDWHASGWKRRLERIHQAQTWEFFAVYTAKNDHTWNISCLSRSRVSMRNRSGTVSGEARQLPKDQGMLSLIKSWHPSRIKTGLSKRLIGKESLSRYSGESLMPATMKPPTRNYAPEGIRLKYKPPFVERLIIVLIITGWLLSSLLFYIFVSLSAKGI
jgi:hypothetical protein